VQLEKMKKYASVVRVIAHTQVRIYFGFCSFRITFALFVVYLLCIVYINY
jgi:hypothetical protein